MLYNILRKNEKYIAMNSLVISINFSQILLNKYYL